MHPHLKKKIKAALQGLLVDPCAGKMLKDELSGLRSMKVARLRIIYRIHDEGCIEVIALGPRKRIYEETYKILIGEHGQ